MAMGCNIQENRTELRSCALNLEVGNREGTPGRDGRRRRLGGWNAFGAVGLRLPPKQGKNGVIFVTCGMAVVHLEGLDPSSFSSHPCPGAWPPDLVS